MFAPTSFQGSFMAVSGLFALLLKPYAFQDRIAKPLVDNVHLLPLLVALPALLGFCLQFIGSNKAAKKKKPG